MKREIKFRAWDKKDKQMEYISDLYWFEEQGVHNSNGEGSYTAYELMQFTGLKDKNGKEAYEDDLCVDMWGNRFVMQWDYKLLASLKDGKFEIFGNIYENPELLNS